MNLGRCGLRIWRTAFLLALVACASASGTPAAVTSPEPLKPQLIDAAQQPTPPPKPADGTRPSTAREARTIARLMRIAEQVRHLRFVRPVPVLVQNRAAVIAYARGRLEPEELERARTIYTALGLLPDDIDLPALLLRLLGEQVVGYYDEQSAQLIVRDEVMRAFDEKAALPPAKLAEATMTLVHELVHALQDQHLQLAERLKAHRDTDAANAFKALYEGDAMLAMSVAARPNTPPEVLAADTNRANAALRGSELESAPAIVRTPLLFSYLDGQAYVAQLLTSGGWERVDQAYASPPESTEEVLHPHRSGPTPRTEAPRLVEPEQALGPDWSLLYEDTLGELELSIYFARALGEGPSRHAAQGWNGDRIYIYRNRAGDRILAAWLTAWDSTAQAIEAREAAQRVGALDTGVATAALLAGRDLLIVRGGSEPPRAVGAALLRRRARH